ncbi:MAG: hypothetical protein U9O98_05695, partial [Asgard group archaeon]|nr:hypothetical protein [Asgard group archaeon]
MVRKAITIAPDKKLYLIENDWAIIMDLYHIIETADYYSNTSPKGFPWGERAGIDWNNQDIKMSERIKPIKISDLQKYLTEVEKKISNFLLGTSDKDLLTNQDGFSKFFDSILTKYLYLLRH